MHRGYLAGYMFLSMKIEVGNGMNIDYKISTLSIVAIYSLRFQIIFLHGLQYCQGAGWWQAAKFEIIQLKTTARADRAPAAAAAAAPPTHRHWNKNELDAAIGISYNYAAG